jgi:2-polyprenyl-3-methyl-5-hydroxy-6-metoxy-1,4-benzoquinol methylase
LRATRSTPATRTGASSETRCPDCAGPAPALLRTSDLNRRVTETEFTYRRCASCGLVFLDPIPADLARYYTRDYYAVPSGKASLEAQALVERMKVGIVHRHMPDGRLVEVGAGYGAFMQAASAAGYNVTGIEMDPVSCKFIASELGLPTVNTTDIDGELRRRGPWDVIALWHIIEHLEDWCATLAAAAETLAPGGVLVLAAPNPGALQFRILGRRWVHLDAPRHLQLIPLTVLLQRAASLGLRPLEAGTARGASFGWNMFGWQASLAHLRPGREPGRLARAASLALGYAFDPLERFSRWGSTYIVVLQRPA